MKCIGILGGMGPQATIDLYQKIINHTHAECDQQHIHTIIDSYPQIEDRTAYILGKGEDPCPKLCESAQRLQHAGADFFIMSCNTAHFFAPKIRQAVSIPLLHIAEETTAKVKTMLPPAARVAVLATDGTLQARIYHTPLEQAGYTVIQPDQAGQQQVMDCIYQGAKKGLLAPFAPALQQVMHDLHADAYLLACTELPLFLPWLKSFRTIDPTDILAEAAVAYAVNVSN